MDDIDYSVPNAQGVRTWWAVGESFTGSNTVPFFESTDDGVNWTAVANPPFVSASHSVMDLACSKLVAGTLYVLEPDSWDNTPSNNHIWKTDDGGTHWTNILNFGVPQYQQLRQPSYAKLQLEPGHL